MVDWATVCRPKDMGGLGISNTKLMNVALLSNWIWKLSQNEQGLWADLIRAKYLTDGDIFTASPRKGSQVWNSIQKIKHLFKLGARHNVLDGRNTRFWLDTWVGRGPLCERFPNLFAICAQPSITVRQAWREGIWTMAFRRVFGTAEVIDWDNILRLVGTPRWTEEPDRISWALEPSGCFSTSSMYRQLCGGWATLHFREVWRAKIPTKIKIFLWQLIRGRLPCSDQIHRRQGPSDGLCSLCGQWEDTNHIFFHCAIAKFMWACVRELLGCDWNPAGAGDLAAISQSLSGRTRRIVWICMAAMCWSMWNVRNKMTIEKIFISQPADCVFKMILYLQEWKLLSKPGDKQALEDVMGALRGLGARLRDV